MKIKIGNQAVSEIIGTALLLSIAVGLFSIVQIMVFAIPFNPSPPSARLVASIDGGNITIVHHGGESLELTDTQIILFSGDQTNVSMATDHLDINTSSPKGSVQQWDIGERLIYNITQLPTDFQNSFFSSLEVYVTVVDLKSNSVVMMGTVREGS